MMREADGEFSPVCAKLLLQFQQSLETLRTSLLDVKFRTLGNTWYALQLEYYSFRTLRMRSSPICPSCQCRWENFLRFIMTADSDPLFSNRKRSTQKPLCGHLVIRTFIACQAELHFVLQV